MTVKQYQHNIIAGLRTYFIAYQCYRRLCITLLQNIALCSLDK